MANTVYYNPQSGFGASLTIFDDERIIDRRVLGILSVLGRKSTDSNCEIQIESAVVSRTHGEVSFNGERYFYKDLGSTNGTYVNGVHIGKLPDCNTDALELKEGDVISFDMVTDGHHYSNRVCALFSQTAFDITSWSKISLSDRYAEICIGRSTGSGVMIENDAISEKHASFFNSKNGWAIIDHNSTNGVFLNGKKISYPRYLDGVSSVRVADCYFLYTEKNILFSDGRLFSDFAQNFEKTVCDTPTAEPSVAFENKPNTPSFTPREAATGRNSADLVIHIEQRSVVQRFKKLMLLQDIDISVSKGEMVLILGGSGAGKTTFINAVMGYEKAVGKITYNDTDIYEEYEQMKYEIGFVPQQDLLRSSDTVYSTLSNAAEMKLPRSTSYEAREQRIKSVLDEFGLSREKDSLVSKLSGGQKKRLSIAVEYVANPDLFFLDEPDSGIDDIMGRGIMENLRNIADLGKIIMVITHSPERAADLFDKVIVLAKSTKDNCGHLAFFGSVKESFDFFEVSSFREIVKKINRADENGEGLADFYIEKYYSVKR